MRSDEGCPQARAASLALVVTSVIFGIRRGSLHCSRSPCRVFEGSSILGASSFVEILLYGLEAMFADL